MRDMIVMTCNCTDPTCAYAHGATPAELDRHFASGADVYDRALGALDANEPLPAWALFLAGELLRERCAPHAPDEVLARPAGLLADLDDLLDGRADETPSFALADDLRHDAWDQWGFGPAASNEVMFHYDPDFDCTARNHRGCAACD